jgi:hypothetical protein
MKTMGRDASASQPDEDGATDVVRIPRASPLNIVADVVRHAIPLVPLYVFNGSLLGYMLLTTFDLAMGQVLIFNTTPGPVDPARGRGTMRTVDPRSRWLISRILSVIVEGAMFAIEAAVISVPIAGPAWIFGIVTSMNVSEVMSQRGFWIPVVAMALIAAARFQGAFESWTVPVHQGAPDPKIPVSGDVVAERRHSLAASAAQLTLIATFMALCYALVTFGRSGLYALPILFAILLVFYDARPDIAQRILPALWRKK